MKCFNLRGKQKNDLSFDEIPMAEGQGLEPRFTGPEPVVLPLDDPSM